MINEHFDWHCWPWWWSWWSWAWIDSWLSGRALVGGSWRGHLLTSRITWHLHHHRSTATIITVIIANNIIVFVIVIISTHHIPHDQPLDPERIIKSLQGASTSTQSITITCRHREPDGVGGGVRWGAGEVARVLQPGLSDPQSGDHRHGEVAHRHAVRSYLELLSWNTDNHRHRCLLGNQLITMKRINMNTLTRLYWEEQPREK